MNAQIHNRRAGARSRPGLSIVQWGFAALVGTASGFVYIHQGHIKRLVRTLDQRAQAPTLRRSAPSASASSERVASQAVVDFRAITASPGTMPLLTIGGQDAALDRRKAAFLAVFLAMKKAAIECGGVRVSDLGALLVATGIGLTLDQLESFGQALNRSPEHGGSDWVLIATEIMQSIDQEVARQGQHTWCATMLSYGRNPMVGFFTKRAGSEPGTISLP